MSKVDTNASESRSSLANRIRSVLPVGLALYLFGSSIYLLWSTYTDSKSFDQGVTQRLELAARAGTVEIARSEINSAITFIRNDVRLNDFLSEAVIGGQGFRSWYENLKSTEQSLEKVNADTPTTEQQQVLNGLTRSLSTETQLQRTFGVQEIYGPGNPEIQFRVLVGVVYLLSSISLISVYLRALTFGKP